MEKWSNGGKSSNFQAVWQKLKAIKAKLKKLHYDHFKEVNEKIEVSRAS